MRVQILSLAQITLDKIPKIRHYQTMKNFLIDFGLLVGGVLGGCLVGNLLWRIINAFIWKKLNPNIPAMIATVVNSPFFYRGNILKAF